MFTLLTLKILEDSVKLYGPLRKPQIYLRRDNVMSKSVRGNDGS